MVTVPVYDPARTPRDWMDLVRPTQCAVFASLVDGGDPCDLDGVRSGAVPTCTIFDSLADAEAFCLARIERLPAVRFDVFDAGGRSRPALLTIVHPSRNAALEGHVGSVRVRRWTAVALLIAAPVLFWLDWGYYDGLLMVPTLLGFNALLLAGRLLQLNGASVSAERHRRERTEGASRVERPPS